MEQAKLSPSVDAQGTQAMQTTRTRALAANAGSPAPATGFAVLLAALDALDMTDGMSAPDAAGVGMVDLASDAARGDLDASALAAWNGLLGPPPG